LTAFHLIITSREAEINGIIGQRLALLAEMGYADRTTMKAHHLKISRSGLQLFLECQRCFWLEFHHKIKRPPGYPYTLSGAVDYLAKKEFDKFRENGELPPLLRAAGIEAKLFSGPQLDDWRNNFSGIRYLDQEVNATLYGAIDDLLEFPDGSLAVLDYKSTGAREVKIYEDYQRQMDVYSYLFQKNGYRVRPEAYFIFYVVQKDRDFDDQLAFKGEIKKVKVDPSWVEGVFHQAVDLARLNKMPPFSDGCAHCQFVRDIHLLEE
jgi:hypothetical protein